MRISKPAKTLFGSSGADGSSADAQNLGARQTESSHHRCSCSRTRSHEEGRLEAPCSQTSAEASCRAALGLCSVLPHEGPGHGARCGGS